MDRPLQGKWKRIYHFHVRKTAGTSLNASFWALAGLSLKQMGSLDRIAKDGYVFVRHSRRSIEEGSFYFANSHIPAYQLRLPEDTFTVTILRDPIARVLSYIRYLKWAATDPSAVDDEPALQGILPETRCLRESVSDTCQLIPLQHLFAHLFMFSPSLDPLEAAERVLQCSAVCFTETFSTDLTRLRELLDVPLVERHERRFGVPLAISEREAGILAALMEPEYQFMKLICNRCRRDRDSYLRGS